MTVTVIIPAHNSAATLPLVLEALRRQTFTDFEVILINDASTDSTATIASTFTGRLNLNVINNAQNLGRASARNLGLEQSSGEVLFLLDSDLEVVPDYLQIHLDLHRSDPEAVGVGAMRYPPALARKALARYNVHRGGAKLGPGRDLPGRYFISCLASFPRKLYRQIGGFDPAFQHYGGEDQEMGMRLVKAGARLRYLPQAIGYHHHLRTLKQLMTELEGYGRESIPLVLARHPEISSELFLEDLPHPASDSHGTKDIRGLLTSLKLYRPILNIASRLENGWLPSPVLTYLIYSSYRRGYAAYLASRRSKVIR